MECLIYHRVKKSPISDAKIRTVVLDTLSRVKKAGDLSVHLIGDTRMKHLNIIHRGIQKTTDVLSFSALEGEQIPGEFAEIGDIFLSVPQIIRHAKKYHVSITEEMIRMLIHGVLHVVGYDHVEEKDAARMFSIQEEMLKKYI